MNFFDAQLTREGEKYFVEVGGIKVELSADKEERLLKNDVQSQAITLGVRPEHTDVADEGITARVDVAEMMGSSVHLHVNADGRDVIIIVPTIDMKGNYNIGDTVQLQHRRHGALHLRRQGGARFLQGDGKEPRVLISQTESIPGRGVRPGRFLSDLSSFTGKKMRAGEGNRQFRRTGKKAKKGLAISRFLAYTPTQKTDF